MVIKGWSNAIPVNREAKLPQDDVEGVDDEDWEEVIIERF